MACFRCDAISCGELVGRRNGTAGSGLHLRLMHALTSGDCVFAHDVACSLRIAIGDGIDDLVMLAG
jgi:hypothetical protein